MSSATVGALLGAVAAAGMLVLLAGLPARRRPSLQDRLAPYLDAPPRPSGLLARPGRGYAPLGVFGAALRLVGPTARDAGRVLDRLVGGSRSVRRRLAAAGRDTPVEDFRLEQLAWASVGLLAGVLLAGLYAGALGRLPLLSAGLLVLAGGLAGLVGRDWRLSAEVRRRQERVLAEFPAVAELLALAVTAGEGPVGALERVGRLSSGELAGELGRVLTEARAGRPLLAALQDLAGRSLAEPLTRFVDGLVIAIERGTPLADVLRAQAGDVQAAQRRALLEAGGRKEIAMMVPVVFLVLPVTVLFALYPGLISIVRLAQ